MRRLVFAPAARRDMAEIWLYSADTWGADQADAYLRQFERNIERALEFPDSGSRVAGLPPVYRKVSSGSHRMIYRSTRDDLIVVRVLHERQDVPDDLGGDW